jgi:hypothetical protein
VRAALAGAGVLLDIPPVRVRVRSRVATFARRFAALYRDYPCATQENTRTSTCA